MKKICSVCGKEFEAKNCQKYCCKECYRVAFNKEQRDKRKNKKEESKIYILRFALFVVKNLRQSGLERHIVVQNVSMKLKRLGIRNSIIIIKNDI